ncbi:Metalloendopeptidase [Sergentomyia squamirostris]
MMSVQLVILCILSSSLAKPLLFDQPRWFWSWRDTSEEKGEYYEGDMILSSKQITDLRKRTGLVNTQYRWPNNTVPYQLSSEFTQSEADFIRTSLNRVEEVSCLKFISRNSFHNDFISVTRENSGCFSKVGFQGGVQQLNFAPHKLGEGCFRNGTIIHEFLHALGFFHMQSAADRDDYVTIVWDNISLDHRKNFKKYNDTVITHFGVDYDYDSVMHYPRNAFSINDKDTIIPRDPDAEIGQRVRISSGDIERLNKMYECDCGK